MPKVRWAQQGNVLTDSGIVEMIAPLFQECPPSSDALTVYDEQHLVTYLRLLDAAAEGADWREIAQIIFAVDPAQHPDSARKLYDSHLARARWMTTHGYRHLLKK